MTQRPKTRICLEGWYYLFIVTFIVGGAVLGEVNLLVVLAGMMVGPFLFNWRFVQFTLRDLHVSRRLPSRICAGDVLNVVITAANRRQRLASWTVMVEDRFDRANKAVKTPSRAVRVVLPRVEVGQSCSVQYRTIVKQRGRYGFGPLIVSTRFPLGLVRATTTVRDETFLLVYPKLGHLTPRWLQMVNSRLAGSQSEGKRQGLLEGDYYGLREWRTGDSLRWIHWRTSAKLSELAVRQFEEQRNRDVKIVLDLWQPDSPTDEELARTELAISFMATAITHLCSRGGSRLAVCVAGVEPRYWSGAAAGILAQEVLDHLAEVSPGDGLGIYEALDRVQKMGALPAQRVVISTRGAPFLTGSPDWETEARPAGTSRTYGNLIWIDCRSDMLRQYFVSN